MCSCDANYKGHIGKVTMEWHQLYFEMIYRLVRKQNEWLLQQIAVRENIPIAELKPLIPSMTHLRQYIHRLPRPKISQTR